MAGKEGLAVLLEVLLIGIQKTIQPWEELLGAVISVENLANYLVSMVFLQVQKPYAQVTAAQIGSTYNWDAICRSNSTDVLSTSDSTSNRGLLILVCNTLSGEVCSTTLGHLEDDG